MNIRFEVREQIGYITLNRPERLNCFDYPTLEELRGIIRDIREDSSVRVVIVTGSGTAFSAGADLKERKTLTEQEVRRNVAAIRDAFTELAALPQPTIAAVNGYAFGGGFELMLACDFRIASADAVMGLTETSLGIIPGAGGTQRLPRLIGESRAKELIFTARKIDARTADRLGLLNGVTEEDVMEASELLAREMLRNAPVAIRQAKQAITAGMGTNLEEGLAIETAAYEAVIPTEDRREALRAFEERRPPVFSGK